MNLISKSVFILVIIGGLNWGMIGAFNFDLIAFLFGQMNTLTRIIYILIGLSALWMFFGLIYPTKEMDK